MLTPRLSQDGFTALMLACWSGVEAAAAELMEATKRAGALDLQGGLDYACLDRQGFGGDKELKKSALHWASAQGMAGTVAQLLALGADATLTDLVRAGISVYRYPHVFICTRISANTIVCNTAWKPERSSLVSFLIVRDNTGQARTSLDPASGH